MKRAVRTQIPHVAVLLETSHGVSRAMFQGILNYVRVYGPWSLHISEGGTRDLKVPDLRHWKGSGILARVTTDTIAGDIVASRLPAVLFNPGDKYLAPSHPLSKYSRTQSDSPAIGRLAAEYYLGRAFTTFAFVGEVSGVNWSRGRQDAYVERLAEAGKSCHVYSLPSPAGRNWDIERPRLCDWMKNLPKPVAVFAANDNRAQEVLDACLVADIGVPYEAAVLGVNNDVLVCATCIPTLSSVATDGEKAGYEAARMLDELIRGTTKHQQLMTYGPTVITSRASTEVLHVNDKLVIRALEFIRMNAGLTIRVSDVASHLNVTPRWAELRFRQTLGIPVLSAIQRTRMATVCTMLTETDLPLNAISKKCGFSQPNHLCTLFKRQFGTTMSDYRQSHKTPAV